MAKQCSAGALLQCSFGTCPIPLNVLPVNMVFSTTPASTMVDSVPVLNVPTFAMCTTPTNPMVAASFGAPMPCIPVIVTPWLPSVPNVLIGSTPAHNDQCKCMCAYGGVVSVNFPGQVFEEVG